MDIDGVEEDCKAVAIKHADKVRTMEMIGKPVCDIMGWSVEER